ncbi:MAG: glycosyltransferase family 4 protein [Anaerolineales bacterium]
MQNISRSASEKKLIYMIGTYPLLTTTFIDREILQLRQWGVDIQVVSIRRPPSDVPLSSTQLGLQKGVLYLLPVDFLKLTLSHLFFAFTRPRAFFGSLFYLLTRPHPGIGERIKTLLHFGEGVYAAYLLYGKDFREIHTHFIDRAATLALVMGRLLGKPYSLSIHAAEDIFVHPILLDEKIEAARHVATCTQFNKTHIEALLSRNLDQKVSHIPHGLDITKYQPNGHGPSEQPLILAVGQLAERKGFTQLIEACHILKERGIRFQCQIIGQGPQRQSLEDRIARLFLEDFVTLCGALPHEEVIERYKKASMFVMPCIQSRDGNLDGIPNVLFEAMSMQVPVISTRISAIPELIVDNENGLLVEPDDPGALAEAMNKLIESPQQANRLGRSGRESILAEFDVESNVRRFATTLWPEWFN